MIREILVDEYNMVKDFISRDVARNYFLLLGLSSSRPVYNKIFGEFNEDNLQGVLFLRRSGVLQFYGPKDFDLNGFINTIKSLDYNSLIGPRSYCDKFLNHDIFTRFEKGAYLSKLGKDSKINLKKYPYNIRRIEVDDLDRIVKLYKQVFDSFAPKEVMEQKLIEKRGRGVCIEIEGQIVSVAQTDFETENAAVIVGVATDKNYQAKGLASCCLEYLCNQLQNEGKSLYLQYDNLDAEGIYSRLGFRKIDKVIHYFK